MRTRYYFHGDLREPQGDYYCAFCDAFIKDFMEHIHDDDHSNQVSDYERFMWGRKRQKKEDLGNGLFRPLSADRTNLVA